MKKYVNWEIVFLLLLLQWLLTPIGMDFQSFIVERMFLIVFFLILLIIEWKNIVLPMRVFLLFSLFFGFVGSLLTLKFYLNGHEAFGSIYLGLIVPVLMEKYKKMYGKTEPIVD